MKLVTLPRLFAALSAVPAVFATPSARDHVIAPEDLFTVATITDAVVSPDGAAIAYLENRWEPDRDKSNTDLWVVETATRATRRLTFDPANESSPQWSADGRTLYFLAGYSAAGETAPPRDGKKQVWRLGADGAGLQAVTRVKDGVAAFRLAADGRSLVYAVEVEKLDDAWKELREKHKKLEYGHGVTKFTQLHRLDLTNWRSEKLVDERRVITEFELTADGRRIAMCTRPDEELIHNEGWSRVDVYDCATRKVTAVTPDGWRKGHPSPYGWLEHLAWSADGDALAFKVGYDGYAAKLIVVEWTGDTPAWRELTRPEGVEVQEAIAWRGRERTLCFAAEDRARARVYALADVRGGRQGAASVVTPGDVTVTAFSFSADGRAGAFVAGTPDELREVRTLGAGGALVALTDANPQTRTWKMPRLEIVRWKSRDGREVEGVLELPADAPAGQPLPTVVAVHGGPTSATLLAPFVSYHGHVLLSSRGYAVFAPNYRGSTGYGDAFLEELIGHENDVEVADILAGVDALVARKIADPDRLAVMGWSNGGFLTNCLITRTDRFKAAISGAGVSSQVIQWAVEDTPGHVINFMGAALPWTKPAAYEAASPLAKLDRVKTPTLIHIGEKDERVPLANAQALYRGLHFYLGVPCELLVYPGEGHGLTTRPHRLAKMEWDLAWLDRWVLGKTASEPKKPKE